jgi:hypothetical protein
MRFIRGNGRSWTSGCKVGTVQRAIQQPVEVQLRWHSTHRLGGDPSQSCLVWSAEDANDLVQLVVVVATSEQRNARDHPAAIPSSASSTLQACQQHSLCHDASCTPDVDAGRVGSRAEQDVGSSVPERDDLVRERVDGDTERARETEIGKLEFTLFVDEQVLRLEVAVQDAVVVAKGGALQELPHEGTDDGRFERSPVAVHVHVLFQVEVHELEDEHELRLGVDDIVEADNVGMLELLHETDLADGGRGRPFLGIEMDLLERHELVGDA